MCQRLLLAFALGTAIVCGQEFEVASVKPSVRVDGNSDINWGNVRWTTSGTNTRQLIAWAYDVLEFQVSGPDWVDGARYDIDARAPGDKEPPEPEMLKMVQTLLADRFGLKLHRETKVRPAYILRVAPGGSKLARAKERNSGNMNWRNGQLEFTGVPLEALCQGIASVLGRPVVNSTRLTDRYDGKLTFAPEGAGIDAGPSLFTALTEQLGLKLDSGRAPVEMLVVDAITRPTEN